MRVLLATGRPSLGAALTLYLSQHRLDVIGVVSQVRDVSASAAATRADVVLFDWHLGGADAAEAVTDLAHELSGTPVIILGSSEDDASAIVPGAAGFATVGDAPEALLALLHEVVPGQV